MSDTSDSFAFGKWFAGIASTVIGAVLIWLLTHPGGLLNPSPITPAPTPWQAAPGSSNTFSPKTTEPSSQPPRLRAISSGQELLKGGYAFDFDSGQTMGFNAEMDMHWEWVDDTVAYLVAYHGTQFKYIGKMEFDQVTEHDLLAADYNQTRLNGSTNVANMLTDGTMVLVKTGSGRFCKLRIEKYGLAEPGDLPHWPKHALLIRWTTFTAQ